MANPIPDPQISPEEETSGQHLKEIFEGSSDPIADRAAEQSDRKDEEESAMSSNEEEGETRAPNLTKTTSTISIAETLPLHHEILFIFVICLAQVFTREYHPCRHVAEPVASSRPSILTVPCFQRLALAKCFQS
jgi:hypothetical protein